MVRIFETEKETRLNIENHLRVSLLRGVLCREGFISTSLDTPVKPNSVTVTHYRRSLRPTARYGTALVSFGQDVRYVKTSQGVCGPIHFSLIVPDLGLSESEHLSFI